MAKSVIGYKIVPNNSPTQDAAPYTGQAIPNGSLAFDNILKTYDTWMDDDLKLLYQTNMPKELLASLILHQLAEKPDWDIETYYVTGSGGSEYTYSIPNSRAYVMIPNDEEVAEGGRLLRETLEGE